MSDAPYWRKSNDASTDKGRKESEEAEVTSPIKIKEKVTATGEKVKRVLNVEEKGENSGGVMVMAHAFKEHSGMQPMHVEDPIITVEEEVKGTGKEVPRKRGTYKKLQRGKVDRKEVK
jgi:hypothetical protein